MTEPVLCTPVAINFISQAAQVATYIGLDAIVFRPGMVSGIGGLTGMSVVMVHNHNEVLPFDGMGVSSPSDLKNRLALVNGSTNGAVKVVTIDGKLDDDPTTRKIAAKLMLSAGRMKITHNTGNPKAIKAPRKITFNEAWRVSYNNDDLMESLGNASKALSIDNDTVVALTGLKGEVSIQITDKNGDVYDDVIGTAADGSFSYRYPFKHFISLIKGQDRNIDLVGSKEGSMLFSISGFSVYLLPRV